MKKVRIWLSHPKLPLFLVLLAVGLTFPSLWNGLCFDDNFHKIVLLGKVPLSEHTSSPFNLFSFSDGDVRQARQEMNSGSIPWWTDEKFQVKFLRPVTSLTHWIDYQLWPDIPALMHLQSLMWFAILVALLALFYRRIMGVGWVAGLAALFFAVDPAHGAPAGWIANRNWLIAAVFGVLCLIAHDRWRRKGWRRGILLGPLCLALALFSAEAGTAVGGYLLAYTLFMENGSSGKRIASLIPYGLVGCSWLLVFLLMGCGAKHTPFYIDPFKDTLAYFIALLVRSPVYLLGQWALPPVFVYQFLPDFMVKAGVIFTAVLALVLAPVVRKEKTARFWAAGMLLSLLPIAAVQPSDRNLLFVGIGAMGLLAQWFSWLSLVDWSVKSRLWRVGARIVVVMFVLIHAVIHPLSLPMSVQSIARFYAQTEKASASLPSGPEYDRQTLVLVNNPAYFFFVTSVISHRISQGEFTMIKALTSGGHPLTLIRKDLYSIEIRAKTGSLTDKDSFLIRGGKAPVLRQGESVWLSDVTIEVLEVDDGLPTAATFRFSVPLEDPDLVWFHWQDGVYVPFTPPAVGETVAIEGAHFTVEH